MVKVEEAEQIVLSQVKDYGTEIIPFEESVGRVLAEDIKADRDLPPYNRVTMDGIAVSHNALEQGIRSFKIVAAQAAGDTPAVIHAPDECIEIMTGAALPLTTDTVVRYEDITIKDGMAIVNADSVTIAQNVHFKGSDRKQHEIVADAGQWITPALISMAASVGEINLHVKKLPK